VVVGEGLAGSEIVHRITIPGRKTEVVFLHRRRSEMTQNRYTAQHRISLARSLQSLQLEEVAGYQSNDFLLFTFNHGVVLLPGYRSTGLSNRSATLQVLVQLWQLLGTRVPSTLRLLTPWAWLLPNWFVWPQTRETSTRILFSFKSREQLVCELKYQFDVMLTSFPRSAPIKQVPAPPTSRIPYKPEN
jgi:hypothetical protein